MTIHSPVGDLVVAKFGGLATTTERTVTVSGGLGGSVIVQNNPARVQIVIFNRSYISVLIALRRESLSATPFFIAPLGGWVKMSVDEDGEMVGYDWFGQSKANQDTTVVVYETFLVKTVKGGG